MPYIIEGVVAAVPKTNKAVYIKHATEAADYFKKLGATRLVVAYNVFQAGKSAVSIGGPLVDPTWT